MFFEVLNLTYHSPNTIETRTYRVPPRTLVCRVRSSLTEPGDARQNFVCCFMPHERPRRFIGDGQVVLDGRDEFARAAMHTAPDLFLGQFDKPALDKVQPRRAGGREVDVV